MENKELRTLNYNFIAVPTNLFIALDTNLRNALVVLLQLLSIYSDSNGYFFRTIADLQTDFKCGKNLTIAILESLYRYGLLQVKSVGFTKKNGTRKVNFYRVNVEKFKDFEQYNIYTITNNKELQLETINYKSKDFKVTYTAQTENDVIPEPTIVQNQVSEETPSQHQENGLESNKTQNPDTEKLVIEKEQDEIGEMWLEMQKESAPKIEYRTIKRPSNNLDESIKEKCRKLVARYVEMVIPSSNESLDKCNKAIDYIKDKYESGYIDIEDKDKFTKELIQARFKKHRI